jgi:hypothetical protein
MTEIASRSEAAGTLPPLEPLLRTSAKRTASVFLATSLDNKDEEKR